MMRERQRRACRFLCEMKKKILLSFLLLLTIIFANGCFYVFIGQDKSMKKLRNGKELNLYEKCSIYSMHVGLWTLGWPMSPQAARECFMLHFPQKDTVSIKMEFSSPRIEAVVRALKDCPIGSSTSISWNGNEAYSFANPEHKVAIAVNPCRVVKEWQEGYLYECSVYSLMQYPKQSSTVISIGAIRIPIQEGLFRYLQDDGWLSCFLARYHIGSYDEVTAQANE